MIDLRQISKTFDTADGPLRVLNRTNFEVKPGEIVSLVGINGSGKTTLLRIVARLIPPNEGELGLGTEKDPDPWVAMVPQRYRESLFPWRSVRANLHLPFESPPPGILDDLPSNRLINDVLIRLGIHTLQKQRVRNLSGGQAQLVAIARALVAPWAKILLLDEPFSALDGKNLSRAAECIVDYTRQHQTATVIITHDLDMGIMIADRLAVLGGTTGRVANSIETTHDGGMDPSELTTQAFMDTKRDVLKALLSDES